MADVRAIVGFNELDAKNLTVKYDGTIIFDPSAYNLGNHSAQVGKAVTMASDSTAGLGASGNYPLGKVLAVESDGFMSVQYGGGIAFPYNPGGGTPPVIGRGVTVDGAGLVITTGGARVATERGIVVALDSVNQLAYVIFQG
jgi:hypothetical protein